MANPIGAIGNSTATFLPSAAPGIGGRAAEGGLNFQDLLLQSLDQVNQLEQSGQAAIEKSLAGGDITQVEVFSAFKKADLALRMLLQIRNGVLEAYNEIKQMQM